MQASVQEPIVSVVVPISGSSEHAVECLSSVVVSLGVFEHPAELVVVMNGVGRTTHSLLEPILQGDSVRVLETPAAVGSATARCLGVKLARGEYLLFTDADCIVPAGWISEMVAAAAKAKVCSSQVRAANANRNVYVRIEEQIDRLRNCEQARGGGRKFCAFQSFIASRGSLVQPICDQANTAEDLQISLEYQAMNCAIHDVKSAVVRTFYPSSLVSCLRRRAKHGRGLAFLERQWTRREWRTLGMVGPFGYIRHLPGRARLMGLPVNESILYVMLQLCFASFWALAAKRMMFTKQASVEHVDVESHTLECNLDTTIDRDEGMLRPCCGQVGQAVRVQRTGDSGRP